MKRLRVVALVVALSSTALPFEGCRTTPVTIVTPQGVVAYQSEDALDAIGALQHAVIGARRANAIPTNVMRSVVTATATAAQTINAAIDNGTGQQAAYRTALASIQNARRAIPAAQLKTFQVYFTTAEGILTALAGGQ
jgi:hypothetical protein